jgi:hypothetical protein
MGAPTQSSRNFLLRIGRDIPRNYLPHRLGAAFSGTGRVHAFLKKEPMTLTTVDLRNFKVCSSGMVMNQQE